MITKPLNAFVPALPIALALTCGCQHAPPQSQVAAFDETPQEAHVEPAAPTTPLGTLNPSDSQEASWTSWDGYDDALEYLDSLPAWPADRQPTAAEWEQYIGAALVLQQTDARSVETLLILYTLTMNRYVPGPNIRHHWRRGAPASQLFEPEGKLMIVLRIMYDVPEHLKPATDPMQEGYTAHQAYPCGGLSHHAADLAGGRMTNTLAPLRWTRSGPILTAFAGFGGRGGGWSGGTYQPHWENRFFRANYGFRGGLRALLSEETLLEVENLTPLVR
jgi:hypothetical protein